MRNNENNADDYMRFTKMKLVLVEGEGLANFLAIKNQSLKFK